MGKTSRNTRQADLYQERHTKANGLSCAPGGHDPRGTRGAASVLLFGAVWLAFVRHGTTIAASLPGARLCFPADIVAFPLAGMRVFVSETTWMALAYRKEVDELRAEAVVSVMLIHAGFSTFSGGFFGVDVFFVVSGYLITSIILRELESGRFSTVVCTKMDWRDLAGSSLS